MKARYAHPLRPVSRRRFAQSALAATGAVLGFPAIARMQNPNSKIAMAIIACGGRGAANMGGVEKSEYIAAVCDVNQRAIDAAKMKHPQAAAFTDFRKVFDHAKDFDAVTVSTCEHTHAFAAMMALQANKHVYCEKPLTYNIWEARKIREAAAARPKLATQMGIQIHSSENYRRVVEIIQAGVIGKVREAHVWVSRAWGLQSKEASDRNKDIVFVTDRPKEAMPVPAHLDWDLWLGPAPERPFHEVYFPGPKWYRWWDFGNGTMSDLGSHFNDLPFWALKLKAPLTIEAIGPTPHVEIAPASMSATYEYGPRGEMPAVKLTWHQGENKPDLWTQKKIPQWGSGHLFIGDKGMLLSDYGKYLLLPEADFAGFKPPEPTIPRVKSHYDDWLTAIRNGTQPHANFEYSGWLTEANHLGNVAFRAGKKIEWDAANLRAKNAPEAQRFIQREYRKGWKLG
ncbi:MAG: Gfo/Idh/MocA family oxidoreductase [Verrucomicrobia bacterium]|nr:Gfo/Idh/MocA family oxidoreductase [Verrucomicrobiota bacterium]